MKSTIILVLALLEIWLVSYGSKEPMTLLYPVLLLLSGISIAVLYFLHKSKENALHVFAKKDKPFKLLIFLVGLLQIVYVLYQYSSQFNTHPISYTDTSHSDILPTVIQACHKFLGGQYPYSEMSFVGYSYPTLTYPTMTWFPFLTAEILHFDYRWVAAGLMAIALLLYIKVALSHQYEFPNRLILFGTALLPVVFWQCYMLSDRDIALYTIESVPAAYYLLFAVCLTQRQWWWAGLLLGFILLSRYSIVLYLPLLFFVLLLKQKKELLAVASLSLATVLLLYIFPFFLAKPDILSIGYKAYQGAIINEWQIALNQNGWWHLGNGLGFTTWMVKLTPNLSVSEHAQAYQNIQKLILALFIISASLFFLKSKIAKVNTVKFVLATLKIYLSLFYAFIAVPYKYLFIVPLIITGVLLMDMHRNPIRLRQNQT